MIEIWEDKEVRFDLPLSHMRLRSGEKVIDRLDFVEDTKGNGGDKGRLVITNLRLIWHSLTITRISLSIGLNCIISATTKIVNSKLRGTTEALHLLTKSNNARFEFIFTNLVLGNTRHFTSVMGVHKAYQSSRLYRELKLRGAVVRGRQLNILPLEQIYSTIEGIWNLSSDQGNLGTFIITNIRLIWFADMNENFNISLPYIQMVSVKIRESKFGPALVVESSVSSGGYVLGFRIDPQQKLHTVAKELSSLHHIHTHRPEFGIEYSLNVPDPISEEAPIVPEEIEEFDGGATDDLSLALVSYYTEGGNAAGQDQPPVYCAQLGLAIESLRDGYTLSHLWQVLPSTPASTPAANPNPTTADTTV